MRIGFLTVKTGPLAAGGIQMEEGLTLYLKERGNTLAGRPVTLFTGDSGGAPAIARTKMQELVERDNISCLIGPLATAEALAIDDYIRDKQIPTLSVAAAEDLIEHLDPVPCDVAVAIRLARSHAAPSSRVSPFPLKPATRTGATTISALLRVELSPV